MGRSIDFLLPRLYLGGLTFGTFSVFPFHFPHFFIRWNIYNPDIGIVDVNILCPFTVFFLAFVDYGFIHKGI